MYRLSGGKINIKSCLVIMAVILGVAICGMQQDTTASISCAESIDDECTKDKSIDNKTMSVTDLAKVSVTDGDLQLYAKNAVLIDGETGDTLYEKNADEHRPNASTTKILTCILALECGDLRDMVAVSSYAAKQPEVRLGAREGESYTLEDMIYAMMLESYNDAAVIIAEHIGGSVEAFADMMNRKAREIGCHSTYFITPNGLDAQDDSGVHGTSAGDLARIMRYCILVSPERDMFLKITRSSSHTFAEKGGGRTFSCVNHNAFLNMSSEALSGKTGFTCDAGYCYVGAANKNGHTYIWSLLGCGWPGNKTYKWKDSKTLLSYVGEHAEYSELNAPESPNITVNYSSKSAKPGNICTKCNLSGIVAGSGDTEGKDDDIRYVYSVADSVKAPVYSGEVVGSLLVYRGSELIDIVPVTAAEKKTDVCFMDEILKVFRRAAM